jgi:hypothetical protein
LDSYGAIVITGLLDSYGAIMIMGLLLPDLCRSMGLMSGSILWDYIHVCWGLV